MRHLAWGCSGGYHDRAVCVMKADGPWIARATPELGERSFDNTLIRYDRECLKVRYSQGSHCSIFSSESAHFFEQQFGHHVKHQTSFNTNRL